METQKNHKKSRNKVLVGFKCSPSLKQSLCYDADKFGITLSSHVETIVSAHQSSPSRSTELSAYINALEKRIAFYEESPLNALFQKYKGREIPYINNKGQKIYTSIESIGDVFTVIINSFKTDR